MNNFKELDEILSNIYSFESILKNNNDINFFLKNQLFSKEIPPIDIVNKILGTIINHVYGKF